MKNKLFLSLSLLTMAFSQINANALMVIPANSLTVPACSTFVFVSKIVTTGSTFASKIAAFYAAAAVTPVVTTAGILGNQCFTTKEVQPTRMQRVKNALNNAGSLVKSNVQAHPRIATGAGLVTLAGLSYAAYNKFGKAVKKPTVKVSTPVVTKTEVKTVTPVVAPVKKAKTVKRLPGGYARRK